MVKKVYKFGTGEVIPEDAVYLFSREEKISKAIRRLRGKIRWLLEGN